MLPDIEMTISDPLNRIFIFFVYGLAFFSMGLLVALEGGRSSEERLRRALRPLAGFGLVHAIHEWLMVATLIGGASLLPVAGWIRFATVCTLSLSFLSLAAFGSFLIARDEDAQRISIAVPLGLEVIWAIGLLLARQYFSSADLYPVVLVWTRYSLAVPAGILAAVGLVFQQRAFRRVGLIRFGRDALWAAIAFAWYGTAGQIPAETSKLPPSGWINADAFTSLFGFPVQLMRAGLAILAAIFVVRFLHAFQVEMQQTIANLQSDRLQQAQQHDALRGELYGRVVAAQEAERQRIARDLHDETGQSLTAIGLGLRGLESRLGRRSTASGKTLHQLQTMAADALRELQRVMADLRPSHLDDLGLAAALRWYGGTMAERYGLTVKVEIQGPEQHVPESVKVTLFRITQEALNNVVRHAAATNAHIRLSFEREGVRLQVRDDGHGFTPAPPEEIGRKARQPLGLAGMRERAVLFGGMVRVMSAPGEGATIEAFIPYSRGTEVIIGNKTSAG